jgi:hypothetical protein
MYVVRRHIMPRDTNANPRPARFRSPAEMPLMVAAMARFTSGVSSPARLRRSMSTWIKCMGST